MLSATTLIIINAACISLLVILLIILAAATRMKGGAGWAALIMVTTLVPAYLGNLARDIASEHYYMGFISGKISWHIVFRCVVVFYPKPIRKILPFYSTPFVPYNSCPYCAYFRNPVLCPFDSRTD